MLPPERIVPFFLDPDPVLRERAATYFVSAHSTDPLAATTVWEPIDRYGPADSGRQFLALLGRVPLQENDAARLVRLLLGATDLGVKLSLQKLIAELPLPLVGSLVQHAGSLDALPPKTVATLRLRAELQDQDFDELWLRLERTAVRAEKNWERQGIDPDEAAPIVEALARHEQPASSAVARVFADIASFGPWMEIYCMQLAGRLGLEPAIPHLLEVMGDEQGDYSNERAGDALVDIGTVAVVQAIRKQWAGATDSFRIYGVDVLGRIKRTDSEDTLLTLLERETSGEDRTQLAGELCRLVTTRGIEPLRKMAANDDYDAQMLDLRVALWEACKLQGLELPELSEWEKPVREQRERMTRQRNEQARMDSLVTKGRGDKAPYAGWRSTGKKKKAKSRRR